MAWGGVGWGGGGGGGGVGFVWCVCVCVCVWVWGGGDRNRQQHVLGGAPLARRTACGHASLWPCKPETTGTYTLACFQRAYTQKPCATALPLQDPVVTLVKEYLPGAKAVACNELQASGGRDVLTGSGIRQPCHVTHQALLLLALESLERSACCPSPCCCQTRRCLPAPLPAELQVLTHLAGMPDPNMKWQVAAAPLAANPPIVRLLGYFLAGQTPGAQALLPVRAALGKPTIAGGISGAGGFNAATCRARRLWPSPKPLRR